MSSWFQLDIGAILCVQVLASRVRGIGGLVENLIKVYGSDLNDEAATGSLHISVDATLFTIVSTSRKYYVTKNCTRHENKWRLRTDARLNITTSSVFRYM